MAASKNMLPFMAMVGDRRTINKNRLIDFLVMLAGVVIAIQISVGKLETQMELHTMHTRQSISELQAEIKELRRIVYQPAWGNREVQKPRTQESD